MNFRQRLAQFFNGRYGIDGLYYVLLILFLILAVVRLFVHASVAAWILYAVELILLAYAMFRCLSRNIAARQRENAFFFSLVYPAAKWLKLQKDRVRDRKKYRYRACPKCKAVLRLPIRKGTHPVVCPRCKERFSVTVRF